VKEMKESGDGRPLLREPSVVWDCCGRPLGGERAWLSSTSRAQRILWLKERMFVRGLQASYNQYAPQYGIRIPHGDLLLFGACCGQIMFAWLLSPETIPHGYSKWYVCASVETRLTFRILGASRVPEFAVMGNRTIVRRGFLEPQQVQRALAHEVS